MKTIIVTFIVLLISILHIKPSYAGINLDIGGAVATEPIGTGDWAKATIRYGSVGVGVDLGKLSKSSMIQFRFDFTVYNFLVGNPGQTQLASGGNTTPDIAIRGLFFFGLRFYFANPNVPHWLIPYFEIGWEPIFENGMFRENQWENQEPDINAAAFAVGFGCEFYVWNKLYIGLKYKAHINQFTFFSFGPFVGYRF